MPTRIPLGTRPSRDVRAPAAGRLARIKPYKAAAPEDTVRRIRSRLSGLGMAFVEEAIRGEEGGFSYCLQWVVEAGSGPVFQTMGKGRTDAYALASAYGEMIERLQNLAVYMILMYPSEPETVKPVPAPFKYYPDEKVLMGEELRRGACRLWHHDEDLDALPLGTPAIGVPFWNVFGSCTEYLPFRALQVIVGSNGMCSGNTMAEALIHGICEVFERHVLKQMFLTPFCPPDVPLKLFAGHEIYEELSRLGANHRYDIRVKDCSMGAHLPVIGLLFRDGNGHYAFHLGADPSPITALERCLTEMRQGGAILFKALSELPDDTVELRVSDFWRTQLHLNIRSYGGHWPPALLQQEPDYAFAGFEHAVSVSDERDLEHLLGVVRHAGWELLIRDNSFLGFPAYHVYIPGIGEMTNALDNAFAKQYMAFDRQVHVVTDPTGATGTQREEAVQEMIRYAAVAPSREFRASDYLMHYREHPLAAMSQARLQDFLLQPGPPARMRDVPACFRCGTCRCIQRCNYPFIVTLWSRLKACMGSPAWSQDGLRRIAGG